MPNNLCITLKDALIILPNHAFTRFTRAIRSRRDPIVDEQGNMLFYAHELYEFIKGGS